MTRILLALLIALCLLPLGGWAEEAIIFCQNEECNNFNLNDWVKANPPKDQPKAEETETKFTCTQTDNKKMKK